MVNKARAWGSGMLLLSARSCSIHSLLLKLRLFYTRTLDRIRCWDLFQIAYLRVSVLCYAVICYMIFISPSYATQDLPLLQRRHRRRRILTRTSQPPAPFTPTLHLHIPIHQLPLHSKPHQSPMKHARRSESQLHRLPPLSIRIRFHTTHRSPFLLLNNPHNRTHAPQPLHIALPQGPKRRHIRSIQASSDSRHSQGIELRGPGGHLVDVVCEVSKTEQLREEEEGDDDGGGEGDDGACEGDARGGAEGTGG